VDPAFADVAARELARRSVPAEGEELPDGALLRVAAADSPRRADDVPQRADLFSAVLHVRDKLVSPPAIFTARTSAIEGSVTRELGRFVLPVEIAIPGYSLEQH